MTRSQRTIGVVLWIGLLAALVYCTSTGRSAHVEGGPFRAESER